MSASRYLKANLATKRSRQAKAVRDQVARCVAGFANAEGGVMVLGIEDDREITGHNLSEGPLLELLKVPQKWFLH